METVTVARPTLEGPLPVTARSHPFNGAAWHKVRIDLAAYGYVQEEFLVDGVANVYDWVPYSDYDLTVLRSGPYTTRLLVTRPEDPAAFSGRVVVEIINMSAGYDWLAVWSALWDVVVARGDAFVGITAKPNVFAGMRRFDPARYGRLAMANPLPPEEQTCGQLPGEPGYYPHLWGVSRLYENGLAWDVITQVGALLRSDDPASPLPRPAERMYLTGESQSGMYLTRYFRWFHRRAPLFDGYLAEDGGTSTTFIPPLHQCGEQLPEDDPQRLIPGRGVPLVAVHSEWGYVKDGPRKRDSNTSEDKFCMWELAGACHGWTRQYDYGDAALADLERAGLAGTRHHFDCGPLQPEINLYMAEKAAYLWLDRWIDEGAAPPSAPPIETRDGEPVRDAHGNALGGLRLPELEVPIATYTGVYAPCADGTDAVRPFDRALLRRLYPTHGDYVARFEAATAALVDGGFLLAEDGEKLVRAARERDVP
jgi:hypothetical protein